MWLINPVTSLGVLKAPMGPSPLFENNSYTEDMWALFYLPDDRPELEINADHFLFKMIRE